MKKSFLSALIVTTTIFVPTLPSLANDCPPIPTGTKEVTVKDDGAKLREKPKMNSTKGSTINKGDKLKVININPTQDSEGNDYCWYKISPINNQNNKEYWIASIGLKEFSSWPVKPSPTTTPPVSSASPGNQNTPNDNNFSIYWLTWFLSVIPTVILSIFLFKKIQDERTEREKRFVNSTKKLEELEKQQNKLQSMVTQQNLTINKFDEAQIKAKEHFDNSINTIIKQNTESLEHSSKAMESILDFIKKKQRSSSNFSNKENIDDRKITPEQSPIEHRENLSEKPSLSQDLQASSTTPILPKVQEIVNQFNNKNEDYFLGLDRKFLKLNEESIHDKPSPGGSSIVKLIPSDDSQEFYFKIELEKENWLFPNLNSSHFKKIMKDLNTSIFKFDSNSEPLKLLRPAKVKDVGSGFWGIEEPGEFIQEQ